MRFGFPAPRRKLLCLWVQCRTTAAKLHPLTPSHTHTGTHICMHARGREERSNLNDPMVARSGLSFREACLRRDLGWSGPRRNRFLSNIALLD
ncbi:hypothetical protein BX600DRAFT_476770 [Xylariales sp. PMI_506]|nr:hypothetical protein BX600DRAFT_476770 [Xylariales sp. PMI_506]